jgi:LysM repeat protein
MLIRNPVSPRQSARPLSRARTREQADAPANISSFDEEAEAASGQYLAYDDGANEYPAYNAADDSAFVEQEVYYEEEAYDEEYTDEASDQTGQEEDQAAEDQWVGDDWQGAAQDEADEDEQRALVVAEGHYEVTRVLDPSTMPIFISGKRQALRPGKLGYQPHSLRARRPRPFFMHTMVVGVSLIGFLIAIVAMVPLGADRQLLQVFVSLANITAPSSSNPQSYHIYIVHYADTLQTIASKFHVQQGGILEINDLVSADQLYVGMRIKVPNDPNYGATYHALLTIPLAPTITPPPPYGYFIQPPGFESFAVQDYYGDDFAGSFGQCTWWAQHKRPDHNYKGMGDAWAWLYSAPQRGYTVTTTPAVNATVIFEPGVESASGIGHVAHVEQLLPGGWILISEMNFFWNNGGWGRVDYRYITAGPGVYFIP